MAKSKSKSKSKPKSSKSSKGSDSASVRKPTGPYDRFYTSGEKGFEFDKQREMWEDWNREHYMGTFGLKPGMSLLDIPCGEGFWSELFHLEGFKVTGADLSPGGVETSSERYPDVDFVVADAERELPFERHSFDIVFSRGISHLHRADLFTPQSIRMVINLMEYVKPGGLLLFSYTTKRDGSGDGVQKRVHHRASDLIKLFEYAGEVFRYEAVKNICQFGVQDKRRPWVKHGGE